MCGIAGIWDPETREDRVVIARSMAKAIARRGPDGSGIWEGRKNEPVLAHQRLSIIDLSEAGRQPMVSGDGRWVLVYNGEIYNFERIRAELGYSAWRGHSDSEVLLEAIAEWGVEKAVEMANGMFSFGAWDRHEQTLWLVRDRLGIKPLYWGMTGGRLVFGSELSALAPALRSPRVSVPGLALYMRYGCVPGDHSIYENVEKVAPGHLIRLERQGAGLKVSRKRWWSSLELDASPMTMTMADAEHRLEELLEAAVQSRLVADVEVGAFLSGGVDSSTIVALMAAARGASVPTFSIGFSNDDFDEARFARKIARHLNTEHHEEYVTADDMLAVIPELASIYSEPFADSSQVPTLLVSRLARRRLKVVLSGDGGDELFAGYKHYHLLERVWRGSCYLPAALRRITGRALQRVMRSTRHAVPVALQAQFPGVRRRVFQGELLGGFVAGSGHSLQGLYEAFLDHWRGETVVLHQSDPIAWNPPQEADSSGLHPRVQMMLRDLMVYLPDDILTKVDRATMSCGLEARVPLLDHRLVEFALRLPLEYRFRGGQTKWLLRKVLYKHVPRELIERPKMGFSVPLAEWLRGPLRDWAESLLDERRLREEGFFSAQLVRRCWAEHQAEVQNWSTQMWDVLMFQSWMDHWRRAERVSETGNPGYRV